MHQLFTSLGVSVHFKKDDNKNCSNCEYRGTKTLFTKQLRCQIIKGLKISNPMFGYCLLYDHE